jgi:hypothetical protein
MTLAGRNLQSPQLSLAIWDRMTHENQAHDNGARTAVQHRWATVEVQAMAQENHGKANAS